MRLVLLFCIAALLMAFGGTIEHYWHTVPLERDMALAVTVSAQSQLDEVSKRQERERIADEKRNKDQLFVNDLLAGIGRVRFPTAEICGSAVPSGEAAEDRDSRSGLLRERMDGIVERFKRRIEDRILRRAEQLNLEARRQNAANGLKE